MKSSRRIVPMLLLSIGTLVTICGIALLALIIYVRKPYLEVTEVRASASPETVRVTSMVGCAEAYYKAADGRRYMPLVPPDGKDLQEEFGVFIQDNTFILTGYSYKALLRNRITGTVVEEHSERFDVLAWNIVVPYRKPGENGEDVESNTPLGWQSEQSTPQFATSDFRTQNGGC